MARTLSASAASAALEGDRCDEALNDVVAGNDGYWAMRIDFGDGRSCVGAGRQFANFAGEVSNRMRAKPRVEIAPGVLMAVGVFDLLGKSVLAIQTDAPKSASGKWTATALVDPALLAGIFELAPETRDIDALMERDGKIITARGRDPTDANWLPALEPAVGPDYAIVAASSRSGGTFDYATQPVLGSNLYVLSRFDSSKRQTAWLRTLTLVITPLIMLAALYFVYSRAIDSELLRWIDSIKQAMLARKTGGAGLLAPESAEMPIELRELAASFNEMARESSIREQSLTSSLAENEFLIRELHHRVKTSLQIIQSYMSLTRRLDRSSAESISAMEARVQVLSIAYRKAFSEGRMRDVRIRQFATEIVDNLSQSFERPGLRLELGADNVRAALMIDRAIPFGLALVESVIAGLAAENARLVSVRIGELANFRVELSVSADGTLLPDRPNAKLMAGLATQLDANVETPDPAAFVRWRFQAGPPPVLA